MNFPHPALLRLYDAYFLFYHCMIQLLLPYVLRTITRRYLIAIGFILFLSPLKKREIHWPFTMLALRSRVVVRVHEPRTYI